MVVSAVEKQRGNGIISWALGWQRPGTGEPGGVENEASFDLVASASASASASVGGGAEHGGLLNESIYRLCCVVDESEVCIRWPDQGSKATRR